MESRPPDERRWLGRTRIDMLDLFKDWSKPIGKQVSYRLKAIVKQPQFGGFTYPEQGAHIQQLMEEDRWEELVEYSFNDVKALRILDKKIGLFMFYEQLRKLVGVKFSDLFGRAKIVEYFLMHEGIKPMPTRQYKDVVKDYEGALVVSPEPGIHEMVGVTDLKSLYPSIILAKNLSPDIDKMIPKVIVKLMAVRDEMRKAKLDGKADAALKTSEQSLKYIINSFYGYMGFSGAKMYAPEIAGEITETGREISKALHGLLHEMGYTLVYGDTDSTFFKSIKNVDEAKEVERKINEYMVKWALQQGIEEKYAPVVKLEKIYRRIVFKRKGDSDEAAKKRYAGHLIWKDGFEKNELDYAGIELKRSDTAPITKTILEEFFKEVLIHDDLEAAQRVVVKYEKLVRNGQVKIIDVAIPKGMNDNATVESAHVKGARIGEEVFKIHFDQVNKPRLLYTKRPWPQVCIDESVSEEDILRVCEIDWEKMCDRVVVKKTKALLESLGFNWDAVVHGQKSIFDY
jgi:DNA polymerase I